MSNFTVPVVSTTITINKPRVEFHSTATLLFIFTELSILCSFQLILFSGLLTVPSHVVFLFCSSIFFIPTENSSSSVNQSRLRKFRSSAGSLLEKFETTKETKTDEPMLAESNKVQEEGEKKPSVMTRPESAAGRECKASKKKVPCRGPKGSLGSTGTVGKEFKKTLAWRLFEVKHGASGGECVMDLLWEACDAVEEEEKENAEGNSIFYDNGGDDEDNAVQGCLGRILMCSSWKVNLRRKRKSGIAKITKALTKRTGWHRH